MGKVLKDRKTILRAFMTNLKAKKQADDSKGSYQKAQERVIARKTALARKRARETTTKHQAVVNSILEDDKLLPNQDPMLNLAEREQLLFKTLKGTTQTRFLSNLPNDSGSAINFDQKLLEVQQKLHDFATNALDTPQTLEQPNDPTS